VHKNQADTEAVQQRDIMHQIGKLRSGDGFATKGEDKGAATVCMNIRRRVPEAVDEVPVSVFI